MSKEAEQLRTTNRRLKIGFVLMLVLGGTGLTYALTDGFTAAPWGPATTTTVATNTTATVHQGVKVTGTAIYANDTTITGQTLYGLDADDNAVYIAAVTNGAFTSNRGPAEGGVHDFYIAISGCILYVASYDIPDAQSYDQESINIGTVEVYTSSSTYSVQLIGATTNTYSSATATAGTTNYTQSANVPETYTIRVTNTEDHSQLYREYTDPRDDIPIAPVLWIEVTTTNAYTDSVGVETWTDSTKTYFLIPISTVICEGTLNVALTWDFILVLPTAGSFVFSAYIVDGSNVERLAQAKSRVADPNTGEVISNTQIVNAYAVVT